MKKFWKVVLAVIVGLVIANIITFIILVGAFGNSGTEKAPVLPASGILRVDMSKIILEEQAVEQISMSSFRSNQDIPVSVGISEAVHAVEVAAQDPGVKCIYLKAAGATAGIETASEFRSALSKFRESGKPVVAYLENAGTGSYYLASVADKVYMGPYIGTSSMLNGIATRQIYLKDLLDKLGINVQLIRHGKYKSAGEMYIRNSSSEANREQTKAFVDGLWGAMRSEIAASRGLSEKEVDLAIDGLKLCVPSDFVQYGFADELLDRTALEDKLAVLCQCSDYKKVSMIPFADHVKVKGKVLSKSRNKIAVVYASGEIVEGYDPMNVDGDRFASIIEGVRKDSTVKAVVLRVNSPGGSVSASEKIKAELDLIKGVKPLVASYGDYAASGGYWISNNADKIYSGAMTLTGSIGVFGMIPDFSKAIKNNLHVGVESVCSNKHGDMWNLMRPFDTEETAYMQRSIENIYSHFIGMVADGRGMTPEAVDEIAQGRVWVGSDAIKIGLVDEIGTLEDAISYAAAAAGLSDYKVEGYPAQPTLLDQITSMIDGTADTDYSVRGANFIRSITTWYDSWQSGSQEYVFARMPYCFEF